MQWGTWWWGNRRGGFLSVATWFVGVFFFRVFSFLTARPRPRQWKQQIPCGLRPPTIDATFTNHLSCLSEISPVWTGHFPFMSLFFLKRTVYFIFCPLSQWILYYDATSVWIIMTFFLKQQIYLRLYPHVFLVFVLFWYWLFEDQAFCYQSSSWNKSEGCFCLFIWE